MNTAHLRAKWGTEDTETGEITWGYTKQEAYNSVAWAENTGARRGRFRVVRPATSPTSVAQESC